MLSLSGVYLPGKNEKDFRIPASLKRFLREYPDTKAIYLQDVYKRQGVDRLTIKDIEKIPEKKFVEIVRRCV